MKGIWAFTGTKNIAVGTRADKVFDWRSREEVPLGFAVDVKDRVDEHYPARVRVGVLHSATEEKVGLVEFGEDSAGELAASGIALSLEDFDRAELRFRIHAVIGEGEARFELRAGEEGNSARAGVSQSTPIPSVAVMRTVPARALSRPRTASWFNTSVRPPPHEPIERS